MCCGVQYVVIVSCQSLFCLFVCFGFTPFNMKGVFIFIMSLASSRVHGSILRKSGTAPFFMIRFQVQHIKLDNLGHLYHVMYLSYIKKQHKLSFQYDNNKKTYIYIYKHINNNNNNKCQFIESCGKSG